MLEKVVVITGAAGFIGSTLVRKALARGYHVVALDKLSYAGNLASLDGVSEHRGYCFEQVDICDHEKVADVFSRYSPDAMMHLAAESHVDRSIDGPADFLETNVNGTFVLLESCRTYLEESGRESFRFLHVSTDEVYGDLGALETSAAFTETSPYDPSSPYAATKAASDHLVRSWCRTYGLPVLITNCSNNYGPRQFPEKLIPHTILNALEGKPLPVYGDGCQVRDWLYVEDHANALLDVLEKGKVGETYNIGGCNPMKNIEVVRAICGILETMSSGEKAKGLGKYEDLITFVQDRPGHDVRYAIDASKIERELGWVPVEPFETALEKTVAWYLSHRDWWGDVLSGEYRLHRRGLGAGRSL